MLEPCIFKWVLVCGNPSRQCISDRGIYEEASDMLSLRYRQVRDMTLNWCHITHISETEMLLARRKIAVGVVEK